MSRKLSWPVKELVEAEGAMLYHESLGTWNTLRLSQRIVWEFPALQRRGKKAGYWAVLAWSKKKRDELMKKVDTGEYPTPLILFFTSEDDEEIIPGNQD